MPSKRISAFFSLNGYHPSWTSVSWSKHKKGSENGSRKGSNQVCRFCLKNFSVSSTLSSTTQWGLKGQSYICSSVGQIRGWFSCWCHSTFCSQAPILYARNNCLGWRHNYSASHWRIIYLWAFSQISLRWSGVYSVPLNRPIILSLICLLCRHWCTASSYIAISRTAECTSDGQCMHSSSWWNNWMLNDMVSFLQYFCFFIDIYMIYLQDVILNIFCHIHLTITQ